MNNLAIAVTKARIAYSSLPLTAVAWEAFAALKRGCFRNNEQLIV